MKRIILACSAGMSTSMLVNKMKAEAEKQGLEFEIYAIPESKVADDLVLFGNEIIAILLGPQVRFKLEAQKEQAEKYNIPVDAISPIDYGTMNGAKVLQQALNMAGL